VRGPRRKVAARPTSCGELKCARKITAVIRGAESVAPRDVLGRAGGSDVVAWLRGASVGSAA
jgi:hypothetical protein